MVSEHGAGWRQRSNTQTHAQIVRKLVHTGPNGQGGTNFEIKTTTRMFQCLGHGLMVPIMAHGSDSEDPRLDETGFQECAGDQRVCMIADLFDRVKML